MGVVLFCLVLALALISHNRQHLTLRRQRLVLVAVAVVSVGSDDLPPARGAGGTGPGKPGAMAGEADALFRRYCQGCHGPDGRGVRGGAVAGLPDFTRPAWQQQRTDAQLMVTILEGK